MTERTAAQRPPAVHLLEGQRRMVPLTITTMRGGVSLDFGKVLGQRLRIATRRIDGRSPGLRMVEWDPYSAGSYQDSWGGEKYQAAMLIVRLWRWNLDLVHFRDCSDLPPLR